MKKLIFAFLLLPIQIALAVGPDEMLLWRYQSPIAASGQFGLSPSQICRKGPSALFLYSEPYNIKSLSWNYAAANVGFGRWGLTGSFRGYSLDGLYDDYKSSLGLAVMPIDNLGVSASVDYSALKFGNVSNYDKFDLNLGLSYSMKNIAGALALDRINLKTPYDYPEKAEPMLLGAVDFGEGMIFSAGYKRVYTGQGRWLFMQNIDLLRGIGMELGYMNNPGLLQWGLDLSWKSLNLSVGYHAISRLNDTIIMGLSWRR
jgi:hypothetical protein